MHGFSGKQAFENHITDCRLHSIQKVLLPDEDNDNVQFKAIQKMPPVPFVIYADLESYTCKLQGLQKKRCQDTQL